MPFLRSEFKYAYIPLFLLGYWSIGQAGAQPFAPPAGQSGSTAIPVDTAIITSWATGCTLTRGWQNIADVALGQAIVGSDSAALGVANMTNIVSLGDGGEAVLTFAAPITNGVGWDFAVFENSFDEAFLEFAFVEVSSDGEHYVRFPATSLVQDTVQVGSFGLTDATKVNNLAGKYRGGFGTPFDLEELADAPWLDVTAITHVKIIDVVGSILPAFARYDQYGTAINEPWPTPFPSSGFDLDAVAVIHQKPVSTNETNELLSTLSIYPNPLTDVLNINLRHISHSCEVVLVSICNMHNASVLEEEVYLDATPIWQWYPKNLASGWYFVRISDGKSSMTKPIFISTKP